MRAEPFRYGGQAVLEGVMMRGRTAYAVATRSMRQGIRVTCHGGTPWVKRARALGWPLVRGAVAMIEALVIGYRSLNDSAQRLLAEESGAPDGQDAPPPAGMRLMEAASIVLAVVLAVGLFILLPAWAVRLLQGVVPGSMALNVIEGAIKALVFVGYVWAIGWMPDMARVFAYHGAEHKVINCHEAGWAMDVASARGASRFHPRCGTNFLFLVVLVSVFVFSLLTAFVGRPPFLERVLLHLAVLPVVAGVSYELIRAAGKPHPPVFVRALAAPGMWLQRLTTREPDDAQLEVAIAALMAVLERDEAEVKPSTLVVA